MRITELTSRYVTHKRSFGLRFKNEADILRTFCFKMGDVDIADIDSSAVLAFISGSRPVTSYWHVKYKVLKGFYQYAVSRGHIDTAPLPAAVPKCPQTAEPYIYSLDELRLLLNATNTLQTLRSPCQAMTFRTLLLTLYGAAIRIGEALSLTIADVNLLESLLIVRNTKFFKTRLVPIGKDLTRQLVAYADRRHTLPHPHGELSAFFVTRTGNALSYRRVNGIFRRLRKIAGIRREDSSRYQPRLHDIRHTSATHRIVRWYQEGADVQRLLPRLSTYLGHVNIGSTERYLTMTPELLYEAKRRFERYALEGEDG